MEGVAPRKFSGRKNPLSDGLWVSGLDTLLIDKEINNFVNVGERTNMAGSAKFAKLIREENYAEAASIARKQIEDGATVIDINTDDAMTDSAGNMETFIRYISNDPDIAKVPFMIDSSNWDTLLAGLKNCAGKAIVNSLSLKEGEEEFIRKASEVYRLGAALIVMAFDEKGQAVTFERKIEICSRAYDILTKKVGFAPCDIIFDVNVLTIATGMEEHNNYAVDFIRAVKWIKENLKGCKTSGGISNLSFAFRGNNKVREAMHSVFLYHAIAAGLDMAIVNPSMLQIYDEIEPELLHAVEAVVLNDKTLAGKELPDGLTPTDNLVELARRIKEGEQGETPSATEAPRMPQWREKPLEERIEYALVKGITEYMAEDMHEALSKYSMPIEIVQGPLMSGMDRVGALFGEGKMFLPQVVKSAKAMKEAVAVLQPSIEASTGNSSGRGRGVAVLATVKGDVHDIGKNIVSIVLACNGFEVVDLGVMVENGRIIEAAIEHDADIIGVSGLITPSLEQMEELVHLAGDMKVTMHRAFDVCRDPFEALEQCRKLGIDTILTSGQKASAWEGRYLLAELMKKAEGKVEILAGAGIRPETVADLAAFTGVRSFHMSGKTVRKSRMQFRREGVPMGLPGFDEYGIWQTSEENIRAASRILRRLDVSD